MTNMESLVAMVKQAEAKAKEEKCSKAIKTLLAIIGVIVVTAAIAYAVYKLISCYKQKKDVCDDVDVCEDEDSCIELEFTFPEDEDAVEDTITIILPEETEEASEAENEEAEKTVEE